MTHRDFVIPVADLERGPKQVEFPISRGWLDWALEGTDAVARGDGRLVVELAKNGREVLVRGHAEVAVTVPCVVTLDPLPFELRPEILLLLAPAEASPRKAGAGRTPAGKGRPGPAPRRDGGRKKQGRGWAEDPELSSEEAGQDTFSDDQVVLDGFVREFILLDLPAYPRRSDLPLPGDAAIGPAPELDGPAGSRSGKADEAAPIDPRLSPLAELAKRLVSNEGKKE